MGKTRPLYEFFRPSINIMKNIVQNLTINGRGIDGVQGIRTRDRRMVGADESTELWRPRTDFFLKWANPSLFWHLFLVFTSKHHYNFYNKYK